MGGKYSVIAKNYNDLPWQFDLYTNNLIKFLGAVIYCVIKYEIVDIGIRKESNLWK